MSLDVDSLLDRRRLKRQLGWWRLVAIVAATAFALAAVARLAGWPVGDHIARISVSGVILEDQDLTRSLREIAEDDAAKALLLRIDSPGGTVVGGEELYQELRAVAEHKPVMAVMGTLATSAGYMTALGADHIIAHEGTITGSIGVILQATEITGLLEKLGITTEAIKSRPLKAVPSPLEPLTEEGRQVTRDVVLDIHDMFVDLVALRRGLPRATVLELADGRIYTGRQALEAKLVDGLGGERDARAWLSEAHGLKDLTVRDRDPQPEFGMWPAIRSAISEKTLFSETLTLDGLISLWHPDLR